MGPFNVPTVGGNANNIGSDLNNLAPLANQWSGPSVGVDVNQVIQSSGSAARPGVLSSFGHFMGGLFGEVGNIATGAAKWLGSQASHVYSLGEDIGKVGVPGLSFSGSIRNDLASISAQGTQNTYEIQNIHDQFKAGRITSQQYIDGLKQINQDNANLVQMNQSVSNRLNNTVSKVQQDSIATASVITTILTAGFGEAASVNLTTRGFMPTAEKSAADWLSSKAADTYLNSVESHVSNLIGDTKAFNILNSTAQKMVQSSVAEVAAGNAGRMTAQQIARATAANVALKYPLYYSAFNSTGKQLYNELDNKKYGEFVRTLGFNAALLLSGGPIGHALEYGGKALSAVTARTFASTTFLDELSKGIGDGTPDGLFKVIMNLDPAEREQVIKNMSAVEATNRGAVGGDPVAAAKRVLNGMANYEGADLKTFTHEEALNNMVTFAKAQRMVDETAKSLGLNGITVGRVDARDLNYISSNLSGAPDAATRLNLWEKLKQVNTTKAFANNDNFDRQIKALINKHEDPGMLDQAIRGIKSQFKVEGFPSVISNQLSKMGYIPIKPVKLEAPFVEGTGKLATKFTQVVRDQEVPTDGFVKAVQPLPILGHIGQMLTGLGLSPQASSETTYRVFNENLAKNISDTKILTGVNGETPEQSADTLIKKLSSFAHNPTRGGFTISGTQVRAPLTDLRQLTTKDIMAATGVNQQEAKQIGDAITRSMLDVELSVRGAGDKIVDYAQQLPGAKQFLRIQSIGRFTWNPFYQMKVVGKTEILSQLESGGKLLTLPGVNKMLKLIAPDTYSKIDSTVSILHDSGVLSRTGRAVLEGGEGLDVTGNLEGVMSHHLLPSQERSIASLVVTQASKANMSVEDFVKSNPQQIRDTVLSIVGYDRNNTFLNSPLARTLNYAFFPFRFNVKVAGFMAKALANSSTVTQFSVIKGMYNASNFLNSPEGQAWYAKNSDVIGLVKYFTPLETLSTMARILGQQPNSISDFGELGGLPFGWIPQILDAEGLTHFGSTAVSPKTGDPFPSYIAASDKGKLLVAVQDLIGALFTYPGSTVGLPSKTGITYNAAKGIVGGKSTDTTKVIGAVPEGLQSFSQAAKSVNPPQQTQQQPQTPQSTPAPTKVIGSPTPLTTPRAVPTKTTKLKKGQQPIQLLPGQSQIGQI